MQKLLLIGSRSWAEMIPAISRENYKFSIVAPEESSLRLEYEQLAPDALILELTDDILPLQLVRRILRDELQERPIPLLALARRIHLNPSHFMVGVDDFLLPPYKSDELIARLQILFRRFQRVDMTNCIQIEGLVLDMTRRLLTIDSRVVALTQREYQLFQFLVTHRGRAFTRELLLSQIWGYQYEGDARVVDATIKRIRARLLSPYSGKLETIRSVGYRFSDN